jgi:hypothetical protein
MGKLTVEVCRFLETFYDMETEVAQLKLQEYYFKVFQQLTSLEAASLEAASLEDCLSQLLNIAKASDIDVSLPTLFQLFEKEGRRGEEKEERRGEEEETKEDEKNFLLQRQTIETKIEMLSQMMKSGSLHGNFEKIFHSLENLRVTFNLVSEILEKKEDVSKYNTSEEELLNTRGVLEVIIGEIEEDILSFQMQREEEDFKLAQLLQNEEQSSTSFQSPSFQSPAQQSQSPSSSQSPAQQYPFKYSESNMLLINWMEKMDVATISFQHHLVHFHSKFPGIRFPDHKVTEKYQTSGLSLEKLQNLFAKYDLDRKEVLLVIMEMYRKTSNLKEFRTWAGQVLDKDNKILIMEKISLFAIVWSTMTNIDEATQFKNWMVDLIKKYQVNMPNHFLIRNNNFYFYWAECHQRYTP